METQKKISLRGSLADDVARRVMTTPDTSATVALHESLQANRGDLIQIPKNNTLLVGKKSELGKFPPDW